MAGRQNKESRQEAPTYGAPMSPPKPSADRDRKRREKLAKKPTPEERRKLIEEHEARGQAESAGRRRDRRTEAPKPAPVGVTDIEGKSTTEILRGRTRDIEDTLTEMETGESRPQRKTDAQRRREEREREEQGDGRPAGGPTRKTK